MRELLQQALAALKTCDFSYDSNENAHQIYDYDEVMGTIEMLEHELNKPEFLTAWRNHASSYEQGFIDGMAKQMHLSVDRAVNAMNKPWQGLTDEQLSETYNDLYTQYTRDDVNITDFILIARAIELQLKEKNGA